ncbi:MAG: type IV secretion system protein VirD4 [Rhodobacteraceae bacterium]|nr:MAG: type IV secretion system protein VirD4 [Paracoccaceae bacterium]
MSKIFRRPIGLLENGKLISDPYPNTSSLIYGASGAAKTTTVVLPVVQALMGSAAIANIIADVKDAEVYSQISAMCDKYNIPHGCLDDFNILGRDNPNAKSLNPFWAIVETAKNNPADLLFAIETATLALIPEVGGDSKNKYFRDTPREEQDLGIRILLDHKPDMVTPGALYSLMADPKVWRSAREIAAEEGDAALMSRAQQSIDMQDNDPEHFFLHSRAALTSLRIYEPGSALHNAGRDSDLTHEQIINESWIFCLVLPQRHAARVGTHLALHLQSFMHAQLTAGSGRCIYTLDELCNAPLKEAVDRVTIQRSFKASSLYIAQSRADIQRKYGKLEAAILEENSPVVQWLSFTDVDECERISRAMGETKSVSQSIGLNSDKQDFTSNFSTGKERLFTPDELMNLDPNYQIIRIKGHGYIHCKKLYQNQIAPTCYELGVNPLEGGILPPDPKVTLPVFKRGG